MNRDKETEFKENTLNALQNIASNLTAVQKELKALVEVQIRDYAVRNTTGPHYKNRADELREEFYSQGE